MVATGCSAVASSHRLARLGPAGLRWVLGLLFLALAAPSAVLLLHTRTQLQWESLYRHRELAEQAVARVDAQLQRWIEAEEARGYADYGFLSVAGDPTRSQLLQRSPLAAFPPQADSPGLLGWFQVDAAGQFSSPLLPPAEVDPGRVGLASDDLAQRRARHDQLLDVLGRNRLVERRRLREPDEAEGGELRDNEDAAAYASLGSSSREEATQPKLAPAQVAFDQLNLAEPKSELRKQVSADERAGKADLGQEHDNDLAAGGRQASASAPVRSKRVEIGALPELQAPAAQSQEANAPQPLRIFESELDPFEFARLDSGHFVLFRRAWRDQQRSIQGALLDGDDFLQGVADAARGSGALADVSELELRWQGQSLRQLAAGAATDSGQVPRLLHRARLSAPLGGFELVWRVRELPPGPGASLVNWAGAVLFGVLLLGFGLLYRLAMRQLRLARQQQDFVSAVSHELKTPLTSIRMYAELLRAGWASDEKKREYYEFIHDESERLSRLIANVLQLARLEREALRLDLKPHTAAALFDLVRSRVQGQIERAGFEAELRLDPDCAGIEIAVDADALVQILINLVDNALKFSSRSQRRRVELSLRCEGSEALVFSVRDHGPGVPVSQRRRIFELFQRGGNELTREATGTGIGLALVQQLARGMDGEVECLAAEPGAEFRLRLPALRRDA